ncbi:hypothetical protein [Haloarcula argentinensis]|uniref:ABM domain-containing protein n=1 Tax=Haloarcula argentinensis TaxID=43776 RepID=A0ABU2F022_HALAR|nr:hypothetical protein [Haloarcula argentinensis]EMA24378.1 hypothetical protein C443_04429 [Haloarcula argentinensis DSM 12282]MDS0253506.1 hypothetical protein [Haloarcula argentinensis]
MIVSIHQYELADSASPDDFRDAVTAAVDENLFDDIPGLVDYRIGRGIKGSCTDQFAAVWVYESQASWEAVWGPVDDPLPKSAYPDAWLRWEDELLAPVLADDPDTIEYTSYDVFAQNDD